MIYYYIASVVLSLAIYMFSHWVTGNDLKISDLGYMLICCMIPILNVVLAIGFLIHMIDSQYNVRINQVLIKGRASKKGSE